MSAHTFSVHEVQQRYAVAEHTVLAWIHAGELKAINVGRKPGSKKPRWRITQAALDAFEAARAATPAVPAVRTKRRVRGGDDVICFYK